MAMITCRECGKEISSKAEACPNCGAKIPQKTSIFTWIVTVILGLSVVMVIVSPDKPSLEANKPTATTKKATRPTIDKSAQMQQKRADLIGKLMAAGVFDKSESRGDTLVRLWVRPAFYGLDFDDKKNFSSLVYAYYFDGSNPYLDTVILHDVRTNKEIGSYNASSGLDLE